MKTVYDLHVPEGNEYVVNGMLGHNTISGIVDIIKLKMENMASLTGVVAPNKLVKEWVTEINKVSKGKINAVPLVNESITKMIKNLGYTRKMLVDYVRTAPPNTIFIIGMRMMTLMRDVADPERKNMMALQYGPLELQRWPNTMLVRQMGFDYILIDESQFTKNETSQITEAVRAVASSAKFVRLASGTLIKNRAFDLPSQFGMMNPAILGDEEEFTRRYMVTDGEDGSSLNIMRQGAGKDIAKDIAPFATRIVKRRSDWGFLMPQIYNAFYQVELTPRQQSHYLDILAEALDKIRKDPKLMKAMKNADEGSEAKIEQALKKHLATVELFVNAPDHVHTNPDKYNPFPHLEDVDEQDLISPKVKAVKKIIEGHFSGHLDENNEEVAAQKSKVIVFCYNKLVSVHFYKWLKSSLGKYGVLHYTASEAGEEALLKFRQKNDNFRVLIADETSLREGINLQIASRLIRTQTLWSPGDQEQAMSRVMRPDVRNEYNRTRIDYDWLICDKTFEVAKTARLLAKMLEKLRIDEAENPAFDKLSDSLPHLPMIRMDLDTIQQMVDAGELTEYYDAQLKMNNYEESQFKIKALALKTKVARKLGKDPDKITEVELRQHAMTPVTSTTELPGSKTIFTPLVSGAMPLDMRGLGLKPLAVLVDKGTSPEPDLETGEELDPDEIGDIEDNVLYNKGDVVQTEYGYGTIVSDPSSTTKSVIVDVPGMQTRRLRLNKQVVFKPTIVKDDSTGVTNAANIQQLHKDFNLASKAGKGITFLNGHPNINMKVNRVTPPNAKPNSLKKPGKDLTGQTPGDRSIMPDLREEQRSDKDEITLGVGIYNTYIGLTVEGEKEDTDHIAATFSKYPWQHTPPFIYRHIRTYQGAVGLVKALKENFVISQNSLDAILNVAKKLNRKGQQTLQQYTPMDLNINNFLRFNYKRPESPNGIHCYPIVMEGDLYIAASMPTQPKAVQKLKKLNVPGVDITHVHPAMTSLFFKTPQQALKMVDEMHKRYDLMGYNAAIKTLKNPRIKSWLKK